MPKAVNISGRQTPVHVHGDLVEADRLTLEQLLSDGDALDRRCRAALLDPTLAGDDGSCGEGPTELYIRHHLSELDGLAGRLGVDDPASADAAAIERFLASMSVRSIWATPGSDRSFLHVDYTVDPDLTQYVLCVSFDRAGVVTSVDME